MKKEKKMKKMKKKYIKPEIVVVNLRAEERLGNTNCRVQYARPNDNANPNAGCYLSFGS